MGYKVLGKTEELLQGYGPRKGLEGPFIFAAGRILYYSPKDGQYWDPKTDFFVPNDDVAELQHDLMKMIAR